MDKKTILTIFSTVLVTMLIAITFLTIGIMITKNEPIQPQAQVQGQGQPAPQPELGDGKKPSEYKIGRPYARAMRGGKPVVALFYVDWCGYCKRFAPKYNEIAKKYRGKFNFTMINVEDKKNADLVKEYDIKAFPTVYIINPRTKERTFIDSSKLGEISDTEKELDNYLAK